MNPRADREMPRGRPTTPARTRPILLIDDSPDDLFFTKRLLLQSNLREPVVAMEDPDEAVTFLRASLSLGERKLQPAMVFCDLKMPRRDGFEVLAWVREQKELAQLPFFTLSGSDTKRDVEHAHALGATGYLVKFPSSEVFGRIVQAALENNLGSLRDRFWPEQA